MLIYCSQILDLKRLDDNTMIRDAYDDDYYNYYSIKYIVKGISIDSINKIRV